MGELLKLKKELKERDSEISNALRGFKKNWEKGDWAIFSELVFCLCTPQSNALKCNEAVSLLKKRECLLSGKEGVRECLQKRVRFHNNKTNNILQARKLFSGEKGIEIKKRLIELGIEKNPAWVRDWLAENVKGLGLKEASHFLRNIGFYKDAAILDRHVLKNLVKLGVIAKAPASLPNKKYLEIEKKLLEFCRKNKIKAEELDLALWARETGFVFK